MRFLLNQDIYSLISYSGIWLLFKLLVIAKRNLLKYTNNS